MKLSSLAAIIVASAVVAGVIAAIVGWLLDFSGITIGIIAGVLTVIGASVLEHRRTQGHARKSALGPSAGGSPDAEPR